MAEQKQGAYGELRAEVAKTTPVLMDKLPTNVQAALKRQLLYTAGPDQVEYTAEGKPPERQTIRPMGQYPRRPGVNQPLSNVPISNAARDMQILRDAGVAGRVVLDSAARYESGGRPGLSRSAYAIGADGAVTGTSWANLDMTPSVKRPLGGGPEIAPHVADQQLVDEQGKRVGAIRAAKVPVKVSPRMASRGLTSAMNLGPLMYQMMTQDIDTDFTVKMIPPQHRKPDETGKIREAVVIVDGTPYVQYEGEPYNVPGYEDVGADLAAYFRENSALSAGKNKLGSDVGETGMEVRQSDEQALRKKVEAGTREAVGSTGPSKSGAPTFENEYRVGKTSKEPALVPSGYEDLRRLLNEMGVKADKK